ncbi:MAG: signal recognition particle-docking protein FtsY [Pseudomonadota bacterium]|nr:MAG: signal recognition particle-docking protein FtsY [Pseudomonadota bacterium]
MLRAKRALAYRIKSLADTALTDPHVKSTARAGLLARLRDNLGSTPRSLARGLGDLLLGPRALDARLIEDIESSLLAADVGMETTTFLVDALSRRISRHELADARAAYEALRQEMLGIVQPVARPLTVGNQRPFVIMAVGVNGVGKTTTLAKLTHRLKAQGKDTMLVAADTFRAAAIEQLKTWGERLAVPVIAQHTGADAAAVCHDALGAAVARGVDVLIVDTAGRQHTHAGLMDELKKIRRVINKARPDAPHEVLLVLDASTGQNALSQLKHFNEAIGVTGIALAKLDGTAKGGILLAIAKQTGMPIRFVGIGEELEDLQEFTAPEFVNALLPARE